MEEVTPYYQQDGITIYHGDCREVLPSLDVFDAVVTDPPYPDYHAEAYCYVEGILEPLSGILCRQFVFWSAKATFPLDYTAIHIWDKKTGCGSEYERIFERNGQRNWKVLRQRSISSQLVASWQYDVFTGHPSQKPTRLMRQIITLSNGTTILDPFMGSGSTLDAAKSLNLRAIGIEIEERYCEIAAKRLSQGVLQLA